MCHSLWQGDFNRKQVVNRLKIPQGLSTPLFRRWSEVPSRGGSAVIHRKKNDLLYKEDTPPTACGSVILVAGFLTPPTAGVLFLFLGFPPHSFFFFFVVVLSSIAPPRRWLSVFFCDILYPVRSASVPSVTFKDCFFFLVLLLWLSRVTSATISCLAVLVVSLPLFFHAPTS